MDLEALLALRERGFPLVTSVEAAKVLGVTPGRLQHSALEEGALARRLQMTKPGRDWVLPITALEEEVQRRLVKSAGSGLTGGSTL